MGPLVNLILAALSMYGCLTLTKQFLNAAKLHKAVNNVALIALLSAVVIIVNLVAAIHLHLLIGDIVVHFGWQSYNPKGQEAKLGLLLGHLVWYRVDQTREKRKESKNEADQSI